MAGKIVENCCCFTSWRLLCLQETQSSELQASHAAALYIFILDSNCKHYFRGSKSVPPIQNVSFHVYFKSVRARGERWFAPCYIHVYILFLHSDLTFPILNVPNPKRCLYLVHRSVEAPGPQRMNLLFFQNYICPVLFFKTDCLAASQQWPSGIKYLELLQF